MYGRLLGRQKTSLRLANPKNSAHIACHDNEWAVTRQADLAARLGKLSGHVSKYKKRMPQQEVIQERSKGVLEFCLSGFREYFADRIAEERLS